ncbi:hypothetical protein AHF37_04247 [Paragonimus kellicotti]|nr:hypothetical protein AHF37_04247 [Paragonimus kellicotti]
MDYPREIILHNGRVLNNSSIRRQTEDKRVHSIREIKIHRYTSESSFSDIHQQFTGADIRNQDTNNTYLIVPTGGHLRSAFSEVEGLDRYAQKGSQNASSKEIERTKGSDLRIEQSLPVRDPTKESDQHVHRKNEGLTTFERIQIEFDKRHQFRSEKKYGKRIGFYRLILDIGRGNFAKVKLATHTLLNTEVAVKVIDRTKFDAKTRKLLSQELANMERLNHPNIIQVF